MNASQYQSALLHRLPDDQGGGWQIIRIKHNRQQEIITTLATVIGDWLAERWAGLAAQNLAGTSEFEID